MKLYSVSFTARSRLYWLLFLYIMLGCQSISSPVFPICLDYNAFKGHSHYFMHCADITGGHWQLWESLYDSIRQLKHEKLFPTALLQPVTTAYSPQLWIEVIMGEKALISMAAFPRETPIQLILLRNQHILSSHRLRWTVLKICSRPHEQGLLLLEVNVSYCCTANCFHVFHRILHFISCLITKYEQIFRTVYVIQEMKTNNTEVYDWSDIPWYHHTELHCQRWMQASNEEHLTHVRL